MQTNFLVINTFFQHKYVYKYTRVMERRGEKSIIDYALINRVCRKDIEDVRARRGSEINSGHCLLEVKAKISQ